MGRRKAIAEGIEIGFEGGLEEVVTAHAGLAVMAEAGRRSGVMTVADQVMPKKRNPKGLSEGQMLEAFVMLITLGGECLDDFKPLREDRGLEVMLGYEMPAPTTAGEWLSRFEDKDALERQAMQKSLIPEEGERLKALDSVVKKSVEAYIEKVQPGREVTLDVDAHIVECGKEGAAMTYKGERGYQPMLVCWAETGLVMADQFRNGNVPAQSGIKEIVDEAYAKLPEREGGWEVKVRSDSAGYQMEELDHWDGRGWKFGVTADMSEQLAREMSSLGPEKWRLWSVESGGYVQEWAEVPYVPSRKVEKKNLQPYRYVGVRVRAPQGRLFPDATSMKYRAIVTNEMERDGLELLLWQRGKAGTIEQVNRTLKDELAGGVYPSGKFGANAGWLRIQVLTNNLLEYVKAVALDKEYRKARPKRLRFAVFNHVGRIVRHSRQVFMRVAREFIDLTLRPGLGRLRSPISAAA